MSQYQLIVAIINGGFSEDVMKHARVAGARGGTVLHARGTGDSEIAKLFGITIQPDKELVLIISQTSDKDCIMKAIAKGVGIGTDASGIVFSLPIEDTFGLFVPKDIKEAHLTEQTQHQPSPEENLHSTATENNETQPPQQDQIEKPIRN